MSLLSLFEKSNNCSKVDIHCSSHVSQHKDRLQIVSATNSWKINDSSNVLNIPVVELRNSRSGFKVIFSLDNKEKSGTLSV
jgi:hypothetical protein